MPDMSQTLPAIARERRVATPVSVLAVAVLGTFMAFVDATIVNIAIPNIAERFEPAPLSSVSWVLNAYNIVFAAFLVGGGQLADLIGRRKVFTGALSLFTVASAACAVAPTLGVLIAARAVQAAGAAALVPSSLAIVLESRAEAERQHAVALWAAVAALAAGIGPPLGGLLITASSWRLVFLVNIPVGLAALALTRKVIVESRAPGRRQMPDLVGGLVLALAIAALVSGIVKGPEWGWGSARVVIAFAAAALLGAYFVVRSKGQSNAVIDLALLRMKAFTVSNTATTVLASGFYGYTLCNVLFLTSVWRYSVLQAGLALTPGPLTAMAVAGPASRLVEKVGHRVVLVPGALVWAAGMAWFVSRLGVEPDFVGGWLPGMIVLGVGAGLTFPTLSGAAVGSMPGPKFAVATSLNSVARQLGAALGVAILIAIVGTPTPAGALAAFENGWTFAGFCFVAGAFLCLALAIPRRTGVSLPNGPYARAWAGQFGDDPQGPSVADGSLAVADGGRGVADGGRGVADDLPNGSYARARAGPAEKHDDLPSLAEAGGERADSKEQTLAEALRGAPLFEDLGDDLLERVAGLASRVKLDSGDWLFREGDDADAVYVVRVGYLEVLQSGGPGGGDRDGVGSGGDEDGDQERINTLGKGAVVGELALLNDSARSASIRALRDTELLRVDKAPFQALLQSQPELAIGLTKTLSAQLQASRAILPAKRARPVTIALYALDSTVPALEIADGLSRELCRWGKVAVAYPETGANADGSATAGGTGAGGSGGHDAGAGASAGGAARFGPVVERLEREHDQVVMLCGGEVGGNGWDEFCMARADRIVALVGGSAGQGSSGASLGADRTGSSDRHAGGSDKVVRGLKGCDLAGYGVELGSGALADWIARLAPAGVHAIRSEHGWREEDVARMARRLAGRAVGVVLSGGGARAFAHIGALEVLLGAGLWVDKVGGVSMGSFVGGLLAMGYSGEEIDACCYEEWVRRNPINDYTIPRHGLIRGRKAEAMTERVFGDVRIEELPRPFYCASVNLKGNRLVIDRDGPLVEAVKASMSLPLIGPPRRRSDSDELLIDGSLLDNLPLAPMSAAGEGPVLAIDVKGGEERTRPPAPATSSGGNPGHAQRPPRLPGLPETMARIALLSSANTDEAARRLADLTIRARVPGVGLLEFHQIDAAKEAGRAAALAALEDAPSWLTGGEPGARELAGRRTVVLV
jgi:NTE family protein